MLVDWRTSSDFKWNQPIIVNKGMQFYQLHEMKVEMSVNKYFRPILNFSVFFVLSCILKLTICDIWILISHRRQWQVKFLIFEPFPPVYQQATYAKYVLQQPKYSTFFKQGIDPACGQELFKRIKILLKEKLIWLI